MCGSNDIFAVKGSIIVGVQDDFQQTKHVLQRKGSLVFAATPLHAISFFPRLQSFTIAL
jgi:threonine aldolase